MNVFRDDVCMVVDFEGQPLVGWQRTTFQHRELGWCSILGDVGRVAFKPRVPRTRLQRRDLEGFQFVYRRIHGLSYWPHEDEEEAYNPQAVLLRLWREFRTDHRDRVAFKGGTYEKSELMDLNIPYLDLETLGCPKFDELKLMMPEEEELNAGCGFHKDPVKHDCAMTECQAFMRWYKDYVRYH